MRAVYPVWEQAVDQEVSSQVLLCMVRKCFRLGIKKQLYSLCSAMWFLSYLTAIIWSGDAAVAYQLGFQDRAKCCI